MMPLMPDERRLLTMYASGRYLDPSSRQSIPVIDMRKKLVELGLITIEGDMGTGRVTVTDAGHESLSS